MGPQYPPIQDQRLHQVRLSWRRCSRRRHCSTGGPSYCARSHRVTEMNATFSSSLFRTYCGFLLSFLHFFPAPHSSLNLTLTHYFLSYHAEKKKITVPIRTHRRGGSARQTGTCPTRRRYHRMQRHCQGLERRLTRCGRSTSSRIHRKMAPHTRFCSRQHSRTSTRLMR